MWSSVLFMANFFIHDREKTNDLTCAPPSALSASTGQCNSVQCIQHSSFLWILTRQWRYGSIRLGSCRLFVFWGCVHNIGHTVILVVDIFNKWHFHNWWFYDYAWMVFFVKIGDGFSVIYDGTFLSICKLQQKCNLFFFILCAGCGASFRCRFGWFSSFCFHYYILVYICVHVLGWLVTTLWPKLTCNGNQLFLLI